MPQPVESAEQFPRDEQGNLTPEGQADRWTMEFQAARERLSKWHDQGEKCFDRYLDERDAAAQGDSRLNLYSANVDTQAAMLYGKVPGVDVARRFDDAQDDEARVAATMWERVLEPASLADPYCVALAYALQDRLIPGFGIAKVNYEIGETVKEPGKPAQMGPCDCMRMQGVEPMPGMPMMQHSQPVADCPMCGGAGEKEIAPAVPETERRPNEQANTVYHYWKDVLWSPCRTFETSRWWGFASEITRAEAKERFGDIADELPANVPAGKRGESDATQQDPRARVRVWEIWCKEDEFTYWYVEGFRKILDAKPDPLGLDGFYPFPKPMMARPTTRNLVPRPDFVVAQDLYNEIDNLTTRIVSLEGAIALKGGYDSSSPELAQMLAEKANKLYPIENMAAFAEKGGIQNAIVWLPLKEIAETLDRLSIQRDQKIGLLQQTTGWADIMRGQSNPRETLGAQQLKAGYGSIRTQAFQDEFARFASDLQRIRAEVVAKHFDVETIIERSNVKYTEMTDDPSRPGQKVPNMPLIQAAAQLIKNNLAAYRIEVKPESINLTDYAAMKQERVEVVTALGGLVAAMAPMIQAVGPMAGEFTLAAGAWLIAGTKGGDALEAEFDNFRAKLQAAAAAPKPPPQPDPKVQQAQIGLQTAKVKGAVEVQKAKTDMAATQMDAQAKVAEHQMDMQKIAAETQRDAVRAAMPRPVPEFAEEGR